MLRSPTTNAHEPLEFDCFICSRSTLAYSKYSLQTHVIRECSGCGLMFVYPQPTDEMLRAIHKSEDYFQNTDFYAGNDETTFGYSNYFAEQRNRRGLFGRIAHRCLDLVRRGPTGVRESPGLLEVGCGPGYFMEQAASVGFRVRGVDINQAIVEHLRGRYAFPVEHLDYTERPKSDPRTYQCVAMLDVLEHVLQPTVFIENAYRSLTPGGVLVVTTVDSGSPVSRVFGRRLEDFRRVREHVYFFNRRNIQTLLEQSGFDTISIDSVGYTLRLDDVLTRVGMMLPVLNRVSSLFGRSLKPLGYVPMHVNPGTKMLLFARRRAAE